MSYDINAHRDLEREHDVRLVVEGGPGWDEFVRMKAQRLAKEDPYVHGDLPGAVAAAIQRRDRQKDPRNT